ncbi:AMP-binding protein [Streptomyces silvisoli]|uniref:AMP-binding protein n=1 Tax=Streptomyces silvisoli TaxID=3034235 RepID=A0ABT5ZL12_9ACTN|nr:AMP-binding protein [Streptomyces silvisoli]MDF3290275.1 AMP-binding protein [Streptomyces silvisoli]
MSAAETADLLGSRGTVRRLEDWVRRVALRSPDLDALRIGTRSVTYAELMQTADRWAAVLRSARPDSAPRAIGVLTGRSFTGYTGILAAMVAGAAVYPLAPDTPLSRIEALFRSDALDALIVDEDGAARLADLARMCDLPPIFAPEVGSASLTMPGIRVLTRNCRVGDPRRRPMDIAYVLFTSGSTGRPKGVPITHNNMHHFLTNILDRYDFIPDDVFTQTFDLTFDLAFFDLFVAWACGGTAVRTPPSAFARISDFVAREGITVWFSVPSAISVVRGLRGLAADSLPSLRWSLFCGEPLLWQDVTAWQAAAPRSELENVYGPTELTIACSAFRCPREGVQPGAYGIVPIGDLFPGLECLLRDESGNLNEEQGELCVTGDQMFSGYLDSRDDVRRFMDHAGRRWYRTGDVVRKVEGAGLLYLGRTDDQTKVRGYRIELREIEYHLRSITGVRAACVVPVGVGAQRRLVAYYAGSRLTRRQLNESLRRVLPSFMLPHDYVLLERLPVNSRGKVDKHALSAEAASRRLRP